MKKNIIKSSALLAVVGTAGVMGHNVTNLHATTTNSIIEYNTYTSAQRTQVTNPQTISTFLHGFNYQNAQAGTQNQWAQYQDKDVDAKITWLSNHFLNYLPQDKYVQFMTTYKTLFANMQKPGLTTDGGQLYSPLTVFYNYFKFMDAYYGSYNKLVSNFSTKNFLSPSDVTGGITQVNAAGLNKALQLYKTTYKWGMETNGNLNIVGVKQVGNMILPIISGSSGQEYVGGPVEGQYYGAAFVGSSNEFMNIHDGNYLNKAVLKTIIPNIAENNSYVLPFTLTPGANGALQMDQKAYSDMYSFRSFNINGSTVDLHLGGTGNIQGTNNFKNGISSQQETNYHVAFGKDLIASGRIGNHWNDANDAPNTSMVSVGHDFGNYVKQSESYTVSTRTFHIFVISNGNRQEVATLTRTRIGNQTTNWSINHLANTPDITGQVNYRPTTDSLDVASIYGLSETNPQISHLSEPVRDGDNFTYTFTKQASMKFQTQYINESTNRMTTDGQATGQKFQAIKPDLVAGHIIDWEKTVVTYDSHSGLFTRKIYLAPGTTSSRVERAIINENVDGELIKDIAEVSRTIQSTTTTVVEGTGEQLNHPIIQSADIPANLKIQPGEEIQDYMTRMLKAGYTVEKFNGDNITIRQVGFTTKNTDTSVGSWNIHDNDKSKGISTFSHVDEGTLLRPTAQNGYTIDSVKGVIANKKNVTINIHSNGVLVQVVNGQEDHAMINAGTKLEGLVVFGHDANGHKTVKFADDQGLGKYYVVKFERLANGSINENKLLFIPKVQHVLDDNLAKTDAFWHDDDVYTFVVNHKIFEVDVQGGGFQPQPVVNFQLNPAFNVDELVHGDALALA